ncbi:MAG TPA: hypothetical protein VGM27_25435 [Acidobacteriaceae bacterium]
MAKRPDPAPGTLEMLILRTLGRGSMHGYGVALSIKRLRTKCSRWRSYPALQHLLL